MSEENLTLVKCKVCGKKFNGESWQTYCKDCYKKKKRSEFEEVCEEILNKKTIEKSFISALKKNPISENMSLKEKRNTIIEAFCTAVGKYEYDGEAFLDPIDWDIRDKTIEKLIEKISDRLPGIPIIRYNKEVGREILIKPREQILKEAIATGEAIKVRYYGGTTPGEERELIVREIISDKHVKCFCLRSNLEKTYFLNKMEIDGMSDDDIIDKSSSKKKNTSINKPALTKAALIIWLIILIPISISGLITPIGFLIEGKIGEFIFGSIFEALIIFAIWKIIKKLRKK